MPTVICSYCQYSGQGETVDDCWDDAEKHELEEHEALLEEEWEEGHVDHLKDKYKKNELEDPKESQKSAT